VIDVKKIERIVLARSPDSPSIEVSGDLNRSEVTGNQIQPIEISYGGSAEGLTFFWTSRGFNIFDQWNYLHN
jgi:hypothetical protein